MCALKGGMACRLREEPGVGMGGGRGHEKQASWWRLSIVGRRRLLLHRLLHRLALSLAEDEGGRQ